MCQNFLADLGMNTHTSFLHGFLKSSFFVFSCLTDCHHSIVGKNSYLLGRDVDRCSTVLDNWQRQPIMRDTFKY